MIVDRSVLNGFQVVAEGYKIFNYDWTANYGNNYCYADKDGNVEGVVHRQEGFPNKCHNGLHFCENPLDCFNYYPFVQWNKFAKVRGYGAISRDNKDSKVAVEILEIVKVLSFEEFIEKIKSYTANINGYGISYGYGIFNCYYIKKCEGLAHAVMCINESGKYKLFNKNITEERFNEVVNAIDSCRDGWYPKFTNAFDYYEKEKKWECVPAPRIEGVDDKTAYKEMPKKLIEYFKSLPEFDAEIFTAITGIEVE